MKLLIFDYTLFDVGIIKKYKLIELVENPFSTTALVTSFGTFRTNPVFPDTFFVGIYKISLAPSTLHFTF